MDIFGTPPPPKRRSAEDPVRGQGSVPPLRGQCDGLDSADGPARHRGGPSGLGAGARG